MKTSLQQWDAKLKDVEHRTAEESEDDGQDEEDEEDEAEDDEEEEEDEEEEKDTEAVQDQVEETETLPEQDDGYKVERNPQISGVIKEEMVVDGVKKESEAEQTNTPQTEVKADSNSRSENGTKEVKLRGLFGSNRKISLFKRSSTTEAKREGGTRGEEEKRATESPRSTGKSEVGAETTSSSDAEPQARGQQRAAGPGAPPSSRSATCNLL